MRIDRIAISAVAAFAMAAFGARAQTCSLPQMASLDMTVLSDGRVAVPVTINETTHEFLVDTGGVYTSMSEPAIDKLGLSKSEVAGKEIYRVVGVTHPFAAKADSFKLGQNEAKNFHIMVEPLIKGDSAIDGVLAPDLLSLFDVEFDFAHKKMNLFSQDHCPGKVVYWSKSYAVLPFRALGTTHLAFDMTLDDKRVDTLLDTGSRETWLRKKSASLIFGLDEASPGMSALPTKEGDLARYERHFGALEFGGLAVKDPLITIIADKMEEAFRMEHSEKSRDDPVYGTSFSLPDLTLGMDVLSRLRVYIAYKEHNIYVTDADAH